MFKKKCSNCGEKIEKKYHYCPYCGFSSDKKKKQKKEEKLGGDFDIFHEIEKEIPFMLKFPIKKIMNKLMKDLEKNMKKAKSRENINQGTRIEQTPHGIKIQVNMVPEQIEARKTKIPSMSDEKIKKYSKLPKKEPKKKIKRLSGSMVYEISLPGVKTEEQLFIQQLEQSIEVKAFSDKQSYYTIIPCEKKLKKYKLEPGLLTLEVGV